MIVLRVNLGDMVTLGTCWFRIGWLSIFLFGPPCVFYSDDFSPELDLPGFLSYISDLLVKTNRSDECLSY